MSFLTLRKERLSYVRRKHAEYAETRGDACSLGSARVLYLTIPLLFLLIFLIGH